MFWMLNVNNSTKKGAHTNILIKMKNILLKFFFRNKINLTFLCLDEISHWIDWNILEITAIKFIKCYIEINFKKGHNLFEFCFK